MTARISHLVMILLIAGGCDPSGKSSEPKKEIVADLAFRPYRQGMSFQARLESSSVIPTIPDKKVQRRTGLYRPIDVMNTVRARYFAELNTSRGKERIWRFDFESFENKTTTSALSQTGTTDLNLPDTTLFVELGDGEPVVRRKAEEEATRSQREFGIAMARDMQNLEEWARFVGSREFERGAIVEVPGDLHPGEFGETLFGTVESSNATVSLFRLGMKDGNEVAHFDVRARMNASDPERRDGYLDIETKGRLVARVADALVMSYDLQSKVTPRTDEGRMLPEGSGQWELRFELDAESLRVGD